MKRIWNKLNSKKGESLSEGLCSILVFTLASIVMLSMIATASRINQTASATDKEIASELNIAEAQEQTNAENATIVINCNGKSETITVQKFSAEDDNALYSFDIPIEPTSQENGN